MKEEQTINKLPKGWREVDVNSIGRIETGSTPSKQNANYYADEFPFYKPSDLEAGYNVRKAKDNLSKAGIKRARFLPEKSILVTCIGATIGKTGLIRTAGASNQQINAIIPSDNIHPSFVYYQVISPEFQKKIKDNASATTLPILNKTKFQNLTFVLAPIADQQQIVSKIEELFSKLDKGIEELKTATQQLKVYWQAVLKWAFEGRLTNEDVKDGELPKGWKLQKLDDIGMWRGGGTPSKANREFWEDGHILWVSPKDMKTKIIHDSIDKITFEAVKKSTAQLIPQGSVLFVVRSGILRRTLPVAITTGDVAVNQDLKALTPKVVNTGFIFYYVQAKNDDIRRTCSKDGTTVESIETALLKNYQIPICSTEEQQQIVQEIESRLSVCDKIEETITDSLKQAEALRQSILKKAFNGTL